MPAEEKHTKRRKTGTTRSRSSRLSADRQNHDLPKAPLSEPSKRPTTLEDLRKARLNFIETPPVKVQKKMKRASTHDAPAQTKVVDDGPVKVRPLVSRTRSTATKTDRSASTKRRKSMKDEGHTNGLEAGGQYVYRTPERDHQIDGSSVARDIDNEQNLRSDTRASKVTNSIRKLGERRHTAPAITRNSANESAKRRSSIRPPLRKSTTTVPRRAPSVVQPAAVSVKPAVSDSVVSASVVSTKKPTSIWGRVFGQSSAPSKKPKITVSCLTCGDDIEQHKTAKLPCTHRMCYPCLKRLFELAVTDPGHMPPRCCTEEKISLKHVESIFDDRFKKTYNNKLREYLTKNKIYCPRKGCEEWIRPEQIKVEDGRKVGKCRKCNSKVCGICSQKMHKSRECPKDPTVQEFAATAEKAGWKRCYNCSAMVELKEGCNHMTCRCQAEFCMVCGSKWKTCDCAWFNYEQLDAFGDPIRYQQEMDRRRQQELRDEVIAMRMEALQIDDGDRPMPGGWLDFDAPDRQMDQDFIRQAREALTANYEVGNQAAHGLLRNIFAGPEDQMLDANGLPRMMRRSTRRRRNTQDPAAMDGNNPSGEVAGPQAIPVIRHRYRRQ